MMSVSLHCKETPLAIELESLTTATLSQVKDDKSESNSSAMTVQGHLGPMSPAHNPREGVLQY